ncbi:MAG: protein-tyrosine-phosphatase [Saprospiraceae bacterium]
MFYPKLAETISAFRQETSQISPERKLLLTRLADYIAHRRQEGIVKLNFICTHNSRRSHLAMIWAAVAAADLGLTDIETFSGGTEATAFNPRAVAALERIGFQIKNPGGENPHYLIQFSGDRPALVCFSKTYDDSANPTKDFAAVMTCSDADENCPFIPGVNLRLPLTYEDPKLADDTPEEENRYNERSRQIGREIFYAFSLVQRTQNTTQDEQ